ncbi:unnamed protein product [Clonostachys rosea]|uniref:ABC transporter domain-containing protein n=1 Tax=Bionectria ochroleuca TaxID=29856 RepID=A0ABY6U175_BIOOC|nr:unnamed protein product [Clonostachys rosea]
MSPDRICAVLQASSSAVAMSSIFISFLLNYESSEDKDSKSKKSAVQPISNPRRKSTIRLVAIIATSLCYIFDLAHYLSQSRHGKLNSDEIVTPALLALAWFLTCFGKRYFVGRLLILSLPSFLLDLPVVVLKTISFGAAAQRIPLTVDSVRLTLEALLFLTSLPCFRASAQPIKLDTEETRPFLSEETEDEDGQLSGPTPPSYGSTTSERRKDDNSVSSGSDSDSDDEDDEEPDSRSTQLRKNGTWGEYISSFKIVLPYLIPRNDYKVQAALLVCIVGLIAARILNFLIPRYLALVTDKLIAGEAPYYEMTIVFILQFLHGTSGAEMLVDLAKIPVEQFSYRGVTNAAFNHVMSQGLDFHSDRDSAEVMKAIEQGEALNNILERAALDISPTLLDMAAALVILYTKFGSTAMLCMIFTFYCFIVLEVITFTWNVKNRRTLTKTRREEARIQHQAVQGWQTVSAFNMFNYERFRFGAAVNNHLAADLRWGATDVIISGMIQALVPTTFFILSLIVIREIAHGRATPGEFVFLIQYWDYLIWPIKWLAHEYRSLMSNLVDAERLLDLLNTEPTVVDKPDAIELDNVTGHVKFDNVGFSYDTKRSVLHDVNIEATPGQTIAFVGATGAGKSSLAKLLLRYYDITSGSIKIDGHDVRDVTQGSLRDTIGVVPQDPLLFNASIMENIRYARLSATDEEVHAACRAASIHDKILTFTRGYRTPVGENGVKLSGGEVQRVAIARAFLKSPPILILDEATSAVDTETEALIQGALRDLSVRRTVFVVAHRLSTIVAADQILVMHEGTVVERGTHRELLEKRGRYHGLWQKQFEGLSEAHQSRETHT